MTTGKLTRRKESKFATARWLRYGALRIFTGRRRKTMAVKVIIPTPLRVYAAKKDSAEVSPQTVGEALGGLTAAYAELLKHLFTEDGKLRSFVNVYLNDEDIRYMAKEATPDRDGDG